MKKLLIALLAVTAITAHARPYNELVCEVKDLIVDSSPVEFVSRIYWDEDLSDGVIDVKYEYLFRNSLNKNNVDVLTNTQVVDIQNCAYNGGCWGEQSTMKGKSSSNSIFKKKTNVFVKFFAGISRVSDYFEISGKLIDGRKSLRADDCVRNQSL